MNKVQGHTRQINKVRRRGRIGEGLAYALIYLAAGLAVALMAGMIGYVLVKGLPVVSLSFLTTVTSALKQTVGIAGNLVNTVYMIVLTLLLAVPIGVGGAIYLNEYARPGRLTRVIEFTTEMLAGIPSVLFGLFGMIFFGEILGLGYSLLTGSFTLTVMILPFITRNTQTALKNVPDSYRLGALGMGVGRWYMIRTILLPSSIPGIVTGVILSVGRIVGESAALLFTAGSSYLVPRLGNGLWQDIISLKNKLFEPGGTLTIELYLQMQKGEYQTAFGIASVLLILVLIINLLMKLAESRLQPESRQMKTGKRRVSAGSPNSLPGITVRKGLGQNG